MEGVGQDRRLTARGTNEKGRARPGPPFPHAGRSRAYCSGSVTLVNARRWKAATHGAEPLRQLAAAMQAEGAKDGVYVLAQGALSDSARLLARDHGIVVLQGAGLAQLLLRAKPAGKGAAATRA